MRDEAKAEIKQLEEIITKACFDSTQREAGKRAAIDPSPKHFGKWLRFDCEQIISTGDAARVAAGLKAAGFKGWANRGVIALLATRERAAGYFGYERGY